MYRSPLINFMHSSQCPASLNNHDCLYGDDISEALALAVDDTRCKDITTHAIFLGFFNDDTICVNSLCT